MGQMGWGSGAPVTILKGRTASGNCYLLGFGGPWSPARTAEQHSPSGSRNLHASVKLGCRSVGKHRLDISDFRTVEQATSVYSSSPPGSLLYTNMRKNTLQVTAKPKEGLRILWSEITEKFTCCTCQLPPDRQPRALCLSCLLLLPGRSCPQPSWLGVYEARTPSSGNATNTERALPLTCLTHDSAKLEQEPLGSEPSSKVSVSYSTQPKDRDRMMCAMA